MKTEDIVIGLSKEGRISVQLPQVWLFTNSLEYSELTTLWNNLIRDGYACKIHASMKVWRSKASRICTENRCRKGTYLILTPKGINTFAGLITSAANASGRLIGALTVDEVLLLLRKSYREYTNEEG